MGAAAHRWVEDRRNAGSEGRKKAHVLDGVEALHSLCLAGVLVCPLVRAAAGPSGVVPHLPVGTVRGLRGDHCGRGAARRRNGLGRRVDLHHGDAVVGEHRVAPEAAAAEERGGVGARGDGGAKHHDGRGLGARRSQHVVVEGGGGEGGAGSRPEQGSRGVRVHKVPDRAVCRARLAADVVRPRCT